jgi:hypothetical protein
MTVNLVALVMKQVGGDLPGILGALLGEGAEKTKGALAGAVPVMLAGLAGVAAKGGDAADKLAAAVSLQDDGMLDDLPRLLGGGEHQAVATQGGTMLSSILGDGVIGTMVGALGRFSGLGGGSVKSLLGLLAPIVMSVLSREQKARGLDGGGLLEMLIGQKDNIERAMPSELSGALKAAGLLDGLTGAAPSATASIGEALDTARGAAGQAAGAAAADAAGPGPEPRPGPEPKPAPEKVAAPEARTPAASAPAAEGSSGSWLRWAIPLVILLALIWFAFSFLGGGGVEEPAGETPNAADTVLLPIVA